MEIIHKLYKQSKNYKLKRTDFFQEDAGNVSGSAAGVEQTEGYEGGNLLFAGNVDRGGVNRQHDR